MSEENIDAPVEEVVEDVTPVEDVANPEFDMGMSDEDFEKTDFESIKETQEEPPEEEVVEKVADVPVEEEEPVEEPTEAPATTLDKAAEYDKIMSEFKANGKMTSVSNSDEVRQLMKMGAGYNKKMSDVKVNQKFVKMLQNNNLLDEEKLSYLIDLDKKNPEAIAKLLKDSELDPMDIDTEAEYKPNAYTVDDSQVQLDNVIEDLQNSDGYATTIDIVGNKWDETSRKTLASNPEDIRVLNGHVESGIYDKIAAVVDKERMLGKLQGVDDFTAYQQVGDAMNAKGYFNIPKANDGDIIAAPAKKETPNVDDKKRAASTPKSKPKGKTEQLNIADMSDDEFEKKFGSGLN